MLILNRIAVGGTFVMKLGKDFVRKIPSNKCFDRLKKWKIIRELLTFDI